MALSTGAWIAIAAGAVVTTGVVVYVATRPAATAAAPVLTGPAILPGQPVSSLNNAAQAAFAVQSAAAAAAAQTAAATAAAKAAFDATITNTTYQLVVSANQNIQLKVGESVRFIPQNIAGMPPVAREWTWTPDTVNANSVIQQLGTTDGTDMSYRALAPGFTDIIIKNTDVATQTAAYVTYVVGITIVAA
jgi:hypothetical protein